MTTDNRNQRVSVFGTAQPAHRFDRRARSSRIANNQKSKKPLCFCTVLFDHYHIIPLLLALFTSSIIAPAAASSTTTPSPPAQQTLDPAYPALPTVSGSGTALEGDLISINGAAVKLWGVDAPDLGQTCFTPRNKSFDCFITSRDALAAMIGKNQMECFIRDKDSHGQKVGTCAVNGLDLGALMIRDGWAMAYHGLSQQYMILEGYAQSRKRGLWSGRFMSPWAWRTLHPKKP